MLNINLYYFTIPTMSPLKEGNNTYQDEEKHPVNWWKKRVGFSAPAITGALYRAGRQTEEGEPRHPNQPKQRLIPVGDFPALVRGFQKTLVRPDGHHFHKWSLEIDTEADEFTVEPIPGKVLTFTRNK